MPQTHSSSAWVSGLLELFASRGVRLPRLLDEAGIDPARLDRPGERFSADEISHLWELAVDWSGDATLGLDREAAAKYANFDVLGYAIASCPDLRTGLEELSRYMAVLSNAATFRLDPEGGNTWLVLGRLGVSRPVPRQRYTFGLLALLAVCQWVTRRPIQPLAVEFSFTQPPEANRHKEVFGCPLRFDQPENRLLLAGADLRTPLPSRNPSLHALHERVLQDRLAALGHTSVSARVSEAIVRRLHQGEPRREEVAASLALTDRTLQRRLHGEGTSFQQLLDDTRRALALQYLTEDRYPIAQVADLLGFVDASNFFRACRRWFGEPPGRHRKRLQGEARLGAP